jgi:HK97 family phage major capsid protein
MRLNDLRLKREEVESEIRTLADRQELTKGEQERFERHVRSREKLTNEIKVLEARESRVSELRDQLDRGEARLIDGSADVQRTLDNTVMAGALRSLEAGGRDLSAPAQDRVDHLVRSGDNDFAKYVEVHGRAEYASAFGKLLASGDAGMASMQMSDAERAAIHDSFQLRAQAEGTTTSGGFAIPVFIDPSVILTDQESGNPFLQIARQVDVNTNAWKGVSAAGVSWSFDSEASEVSDDSITLAQPSVTVFQARGFIPYSIEVGEDWPGFGSEMARLLAIGYDELLIDKFSRGSGSGEPKGILTSAAAATPTTIVTSMTDGAFGQEDIYATWAALPQKYRRRASWMMSVDHMNKIRAFGDASHWHAVTVQLPQGSIDLLFERAVYESPYFPAFSSTTGAANRLVVGDWSQYVVARRTGMSVELVPHLFSTGNGRPTGSRGFFAHARIGGASVDDAAFRLLANT